MNRTLTIIAAFACATCINAAASIVVTVDEYGHGSVNNNGTVTTLSGSLQPDSFAGGSSLTYTLPFSVTAGFLVAREGASTTVSDVVHFFNNSFIFYSDNVDGTDAPADRALPTVGSPASETSPESGPEGANSFTWTAPSSAFVGGSTALGSISYKFISDGVVPEPSTTLAGALLLLPLGISGLRMLHRGRTQRAL